MLIALTQVTSPVRAGTVLEWRFDGNLSDTSGNSLHGTWAGGGSSAFGTGPEGSPCIFLDGSHYVKRPVNDAALRMGTMTVEAYIKPTVLGGQQNILDFRQSNGGYDLRLMGNQQAQFTIQLSGSNGIGITTHIGSVAANQWVHVAATRDAASVSRIYINGSLHRTTSSTSNATNSTFPFQVGRPVFTAFPHFFHGFIDHVRVSNTALSPDQFLSPVVDCNGNGVIDNADIANGTSLDCNGNAVPDECDIADGLSEDVNGNSVPDECEFGSCCGFDGACSLSLPDDCVTGIWTGGASCEPNICDNGALYAIASGSIAGKLFRISRVDAVATLIGDTGVPFESLAYDPSSQRLLAVNGSTGG